MKFFLSFSIFILLSACGGGGGGGSSVSSTIPFTASGSGTVKKVSVAHNGAYRTDYGNNIGTLTYNVSPSGLTVSATQGNLYGEAFVSRFISSGTTSSHTTGFDHTHYESTYASGSRTGTIYIDIPSNYYHQFAMAWIVEDNIYDYLSHMAVIPYVATPYASLPSSGTATYTGEASGIYYDTTNNQARELSGTVQIQANWTNKTIAAAYAPYAPGMTFATLSSGNLSIDSNSQFYGPMTGSGWGGVNNIYGTFAGSAYQEVGGVINIQPDYYDDDVGIAQWMAKK